MRIAAQAPHTPARIAERARLLGERLGLQAELRRARQWSPWVLLGLVALIVVAGLALAGNVVGGGERHINVIDLAGARHDGVQARERAPHHHVAGQQRGRHGDRSPGLTSVTPGPTASTTPTASEPSPSGSASG